MREGGPKDSSDYGAKNPYTVKSYRKKGAQSEVLPSRHALTQLTRGDLYARQNGWYGKRARKDGASPQY